MSRSARRSSRRSTRSPRRRSTSPSSCRPRTWTPSSSIAPTTSAPTRGGARAYKLLGEAMRRSGKAALGRYAARGKQYLVLLRPLGARLVMQQLFYADEIRPPEEIPVEEADLKETEVQLALQLIEQTASADGFHPERYRDSVKQRVA